MYTYFLIIFLCILIHYINILLKYISTRQFWLKYNLNNRYKEHTMEFYIATLKQSGLGNIDYYYFLFNIIVAKSCMNVKP